MNNGFGDFGYGVYNCNPEYFMKKELEKKALKRLGSYTAWAILLCVLLQSVIIFMLQLFNLYDRYFSDAYFSSAVDIIVVVFGMLLPFALMGGRMKKASETEQPLMLGRPYKASLMLPAVLSGLGFCMLGNIINSYISAFFSSVNVEFTSPEIPMAEGVGGIILTFFRVAITAAVVEELAFRGYVMGNLRRYGDGFAIAVSSVVFALLHGNMVQAPFALMAGCALGYLSVKTGTLWTGIIIHALNNSISTVIYYLSEHYGEDEILGLYVIILYGTLLLGMLSFAYFAIRTRKQPLFTGQSVLTNAEKIKAYFLNLPMLMAIAYMLYVTAEYIKTGS